MTNAINSQNFASVLDSQLTSELIYIDGGAKNGSRDLPRLARYVSAYGFEPNSKEFESIQQGTIPKGIPGYKTVKYLPYALLEQSGKATLYITKRPAASSTLRPNQTLLNHFARDNWSQMGEVNGEEIVEGISLADFMSQQKISHIDFLKLDTQGNELGILKSAGEFLQKISVIKTEVEMIQLYEGQPLLGDMCAFLAQHGFHLLDLQWTHPCRRFHFSPDLPLNSYGLVWGDAIFVQAPFDFSGERKLEQALILAEIGYLDLALYIIENLPSLSASDKSILLAHYQQPIPLTTRSKIKKWIKAKLLRRPEIKTSKQVARVP
jgi:FkbM family methyltransferase